MVAAFLVCLAPVARSSFQICPTPLCPTCSTINGSIAPKNPGKFPADLPAPKRENQGDRSTLLDRSFLPPYRSPWPPTPTHAAG